MKDDHTTNSCYLTYTFSLWEVGRTYFLSSGVKEFNSQEIQCQYTVHVYLIDTYPSVAKISSSQELSETALSERYYMPHFLQKDRTKSPTFRLIQTVKQKVLSWTSYSALYLGMEDSTYQEVEESQYRHWQRGQNSQASSCKVMSAVRIGDFAISKPPVLKQAPSKHRPAFLN